MRYESEKERIKIGFDKATSSPIYLDELLLFKAPEQKETKFYKQ